MGRRRVAAVGLCVVLAGCGAKGAASGGSPSTTPSIQDLATADAAITKLIQEVGALQRTVDCMKQANELHQNIAFC